MSLVGPKPPPRINPLLFLLEDVREERSNPVSFPPGETSFSMARTMRFASDPLALLLESYERFGPVFTLRIFHGNVVFMIGPAANHYITVSHAGNFSWRDGHFRDLIGLMGDGLLTTDGDFHRSCRTLLLPAFHRERIAASVDLVLAETEQALGLLEPGSRVDLYSWTRRLSLRIAMRALFGLDPDGPAAEEIDLAALFERALSFYSSAYPLRVLRGPRTPWTVMQQAARQLDGLIYSEISERRASGRRGPDIISLLLDARDEESRALGDRQIRDQVLTLLFAGHDTATSAIAFLFHELARNPEVADRLRAEQDAVLGGRPPGADQLTGESLPELEMAFEEALRMYPPAWIGPRRSHRPFEFEGHMVPGETYVDYSSWVSHHLPEVFPEPFVFRPERFTAAARASLPRGAYIPFGAGSRTCLGMRFGQLEVRAVATMLLSRFALELPTDFRLRTRQMPTLSPREGLPVIVCERPSAALTPA
jgi:cytochrome P450